MNYLTRDDLLDLHAHAIEQFGGRLGIRSQDRVLAAVCAPQQVMFDEELYPDLASKAAIIGFMVLKNRPFNGANEVTALLVVLRMLAINGYAVAGEFPGRLSLILRSILNSELDQRDLSNWLREELPDRTKVMQ